MTDPKPRLTFFSLPKPFVGDNATPQHNALRSWLALNPRPDVILIGDEEGIEEAAHDHGVRHIGQVARSDLGTPLLDGAFRSSAAIATTPNLGYVNADILLFQDFAEAVERIELDPFLMVGRRWDLDIREALELSDLAVRQRVRDRARREGTLHPPSGIDYFVFPRNIDWEMPPFIVGRPAWDNWLVYEARRRRIPVIDATRDTTVVHQNHDYAHVPSGRAGYEGPEGDQNAVLAGDRRCHILDATHVLENGRLRKPREREYLVERFYTAHLIYPWTRPIMAILRVAVRLLRSAQRAVGRGPTAS